MIVECPKCGLRFDDNNYEWNCPQHMGLGGICPGCDLYNCLCPENTRNPRSKKYKIEERVQEVMNMNANNGEITEEELIALHGPEVSEVLRQAIAREDAFAEEKKLTGRAYFTDINGVERDLPKFSEDTTKMTVVVYPVPTPMQEPIHFQVINTETHHGDGTPRQYYDDGSEIALEDILQVKKEIAQGANSVDE